MTTVPVTLQISLAPSDYAHALHLLAHQVRAWRGQVTEILLTTDFHRSVGRFSARWDEGVEKIQPLAQSIPGARVVPVDYGTEAQARVANEFFGGRPVPAKDFRGGPFYSYFFGLAEAKHDHVLHADSDMFFGGGSSSWLEEATTHMAAHPEVLFAAPHPGPPRDDGELIQADAAPESDAKHVFRFTNMSTRLFLVSRSRWRERLGSLPTRRPRTLRASLAAWLNRNPRWDLPENLISDAMQQRGLIRREFLGASPGMWSLHPPYRCRDFYEKLPELVRRIESGDIPANQRGDHDVNASLVDWSEALTRLRHDRWWRRVPPRLQVTR